MAAFGRGICDDIAGRIGVYGSDWTDAANSKVVASTFFIFFTSVGPAITFSLLLTDETEGQIGAIEVLLATAITGIFFSVFAGQPLIIVGVTGPVSILTVSIYALTEQWGIKFIPFYAWSQIWAAAMLVLLAAFNSCDALRHVTRFSCEIFGILIAMLYLFTGIDGIVKVLGNTGMDFGACLLQFIISIGTFYLAQQLSNARTWMHLTDSIRDLVSDYGATVSILLWSIVPTLAHDRLGDATIPTLFVPLTFQTTSGRAWFVDFTDLPVWAVFAAAFPGLIIAVLFFFDHNVSSLLAQDSDLKLKKRSAFHLDFLIIGLCMLLTGLLGLPPTNGLIPQAPLHTKSLSIKKRIVVDGVPSDEFEIDYVIEQRVSNLLQSTLCGLVCFRPFSDALREIPTAVLYGLFLFLGTSSFEDNEMAYRTKLVFMDPALRKRLVHPYAFSKVDFPVVRRYTLLQLLFCFVIFGVTFTPAGVIFPVLIALLVIVRLYALPRWFTPCELKALDSHILSEGEPGSETGDFAEVCAVVVDPSAACGEGSEDAHSGKDVKEAPDCAGDIEVPAIREETGGDEKTLRQPSIA